MGQPGEQEPLCSQERHAIGGSVMSALGPSLQAILVIDNSLLVMLSDFYCERLSTSFSGAALVQTVQNGISDQLEVLRHFAQDGQLHCAESVALEFKPHEGRLSAKSGITPSICKPLAHGVCGLLNRAADSPEAINTLRGLPFAPRKLVGQDGLSDADFSLVALALQLSANGGPVYILTNDQDLLRFVSWVRNRPEACAIWERAPQIEAMHSLHYLELVHRDCRIATNEMADLLNFAAIEHYARKELAGTDKGTWIMQDLLDVNRSILQSQAEKVRREEAR